MRLRRLVVAALAAAAAYFAVFGGTFDVFDVRRLERELAREAAALDSVRAEIAWLAARADSLESDPAALERIARERYGMIRPGERLYRFAEPAPAPSAGSGAGGDASPESR